MDCTYFFKILKPNKKISLIIDQHDNEGKLLYAAQDGIRIDLDNKNLILSYLRHPLMTFKIIAAIHFEAFKLWIKGCLLYTSPSPRDGLLSRMPSSA